MSAGADRLFLAGGDRWRIRRNGPVYDRWEGAEQFSAESDRDLRAASDWGMRRAAMQSRALGRQGRGGHVSPLHLAMAAVLRCAEDFLFSRGDLRTNQF